MRWLTLGASCEKRVFKAMRRGHVSALSPGASDARHEMDRRAD
jgi:hypothetical protein